MTEQYRRIERSLLRYSEHERNLLEIASIPRFCINKQISHVHLVLRQIQIPFPHIVSHGDLNYTISCSAILKSNVAAQISGLSATSRTGKLDASHKAISLRFLTVPKNNPHPKHKVSFSISLNARVLCEEYRIILIRARLRNMLLSKLDKPMIGAYEQVVTSNVMIRSEWRPVTRHHS